MSDLSMQTNTYHTLKILKGKNRVLIMQKFSKCTLTQINVVQTSTTTIERAYIIYHANLRQTEGGQAKAEGSQVSVWREGVPN